MNYLQDQRVRLSLTRPFGRTLLLAFTILAALTLSLEGLARTPLIRERLPFQAYGTNHVQFETQLRYLEAFVSQHGAPDCLILGNSQSLRGIDPQVFMSAYQEHTGAQPNCYNFSIIGANIATTVLFAQMMIARYDLYLIILGTNFLDYTEEQEYRWDKRFMENDWIAYQLGEWSARGWLLDRSYAFRVLTFISYGAPNGFNFEKVSKDIDKWTEQLTAYGYGNSKTVYNLAEEVKPGAAKNFLAQFGDYTLSVLNLDGLEKIIQLAQEGGIQVFVVEMPYHPSLIELVDESGNPHPQIDQINAFIWQVNQELDAIATRYQVPYWKTSDLEIYPGKGWHDRYHLNHNGGQVFSRWLAEKITEAIEHGDLEGLGN
ncbi:hypothetical protein ACFLZW_01890 [Chloroflexota bacterium]